MIFSFFYFFLLYLLPLNIRVTLKYFFFKYFSKVKKYLSLLGVVNMKIKGGGRGGEEGGGREEVKFLIKMTKVICVICIFKRNPIRHRIICHLHAVPRFSFIY